MPIQGDPKPVALDWDAESGDKTVAAAESGVIWALLQCSVGADAETEFRYYSGSSAGTALSGPMPVAARGGFCDGQHMHVPLAVTTSGQALVVNSSAVITGGGHATYARWK